MPHLPSYSSSKRQPPSARVSSCMHMYEHKEGPVNSQGQQAYLGLPISCLAGFPLGPTQVTLFKTGTPHTLMLLACSVFLKLPSNM